MRHILDIKEIKEVKADLDEMQELISMINNIDDIIPINPLTPYKGELTFRSLEKCLHISGLGKGLAIGVLSIVKEKCLEELQTKINRFCLEYSNGLL